MDIYQEFIHQSRYARYLDSEGRRETWPETVNRYIGFMKSKAPLDDDIYEELRKGILDMDVMPSMRAMMTAGPALERCNVAGFNCAYVAVDHPRVFDEILYILMCGTGVGFSVERQEIAKLPVVWETFETTETVIVVEDSKEGWANAFRELIAMLWKGYIPSWDVSKVRPAGARLKTFGGRASGPGPLVDLFNFSVRLFQKAAGRRLTSIECHDLVCKVAEIVVVGGVRRSALISLSNLSDDRMRDAKTGQWWETEPQRSLANNSAVYTEKPDMATFIEEWTTLYKSKSGERGIFNREASKKKVAENGRRDPGHAFGTNPCSEIILRSAQFCNLSEVVCREGDTLVELKRKVRLATILGTIQSAMTDFKYLRKIWKRNTEEERLLGVSLTGIVDCRFLRECSEEDLTLLRDYAIWVNKQTAGKLNIQPSAAITCVKPSGCRPVDALTTTTQGVLMLDELFEQHPLGATWGDIQGFQAVNDNEPAGLTRTFVNGDSPIIEIEMAYGLRVKSTPNHQWYLSNREAYVATKDIKEGDILDIRLGVYRNENSAPFNMLLPHAFAMRNDCIIPTLPQELNEDIAWFLGYLWGDGAMSPEKYRLRFVDARIENLEKAKRILKDHFGLEASLKRLPDRKALTLEIGNKLLWHWLIKNDIWKYYNSDIDVVPQLVRRSAWTHIVAFFAGLLDSDGCVHTYLGKVKSVWTTASCRFAEHIQHLGWAVGLGLGCSHNNRRGEGAFTHKSMYLLTLSKHVSPDAHAVLLRNSTKYQGFSGAIFHHQSEERRPSARNQVGSVREIRYLPPEPTYDVETTSHWFYAGAVKSHNTVSALTNSSSGIHARHSDYYIRTVRGDNKDPLSQFMADKGIPVEPCVMKPDTTVVFSFPHKSPEGAVTRNDMTAVQQLEFWLKFQRGWCEHKPSVTISVREHEWLEVGAWVYRHFDEMSGVSFLPHSEHVYQQAPYQECSEETYLALKEKMPEAIDWKELANYEKGDNTKGAQTYACSAGVCEVVDLIA